jgi:hypothetical protein
VPLHLYCIVPGTTSAPSGLEGVDGHPARAVAEGDLAAWISESAEGAATMERMEAHDRVVRAALREVTPLPVRYGPPLPSEEGVRSRLREHADTYREALARVEGCVEMAVRVALPPVPSAADPGSGQEALASAETPGRRYLEVRRQELIRAEAEAAAGERIERRISERVGGMARDSRSSIAPGRDGTVLALAHLVLRNDMRAYREVIADLARDGLSLTASGPWAPYSFV